MKPQEAIIVLKNTAWLGTDEEREKVEEAIYTLEEIIPPLEWFTEYMRRKMEGKD